LVIYTETAIVRVGYFTNKYPAVSHTFIRREIQAIGELGVTVSRYALRADEYLVDPEDKKEKGQTRYVLGVNAGEAIRCCVLTLFGRPLPTCRAIQQTFRIGWRSDRGILRHLIYLMEAAVLAQWCREDGIQHLHAHFGTNSAAIALLAWRLSGIPYSFTAHGPDEFEKAEWLSLDVKLEHAAFAVCVSSFGRSQLMRWSRPDQWHKISVVHCGVDSSFFDAPTNPIPSAPQLVCVGRIDVQKAQIVLVAAARRLKEAGIHCQIVLAGDGPMRPLVEEAIERAGMKQAIALAGWVSGEGVKTELAAARALVLPSFAENMPVVIMEALARGRPVISTYIAGIPELVRPGVTGWLVPAGDEIALAEAMREALEASVEQIETMGAAGRLHIAEQHDARKEAVKLRRLFEGCISANLQATLS
jgi:colanic acid/amylovoran biosynthesis glycosyltransferase